nr:MAG TPA: hypothetical protein [Caudoviricetes sp.]
MTKTLRPALPGFLLPFRFVFTDKTCQHHLDLLE